MQLYCFWISWIESLRYFIQFSADPMSLTLKDGDSTENEIFLPSVSR